MIQATIGHIQFNVQPENFAFYKDLFAFAGWSTLYDDPAMLGIGSQDGSSLWFAGGAKDVSNDYDGPGMNHIGLGVRSVEDVDRAVEYLQSKNVTLLFETPRHRPEFCAGPENTYYQVMFESPDRILFEVVYTGPKPA